MANIKVNSTVNTDLNPVHHAKKYTAELIAGVLACFTVVGIPLGIGLIAHSIYKKYQESKALFQQEAQNPTPIVSRQIGEPSAPPLTATFHNLENNEIGEMYAKHVHYRTKDGFLIARNTSYQHEPVRSAKNTEKVTISVNPADLDKAWDIVHDVALAQGSPIYSVEIAIPSGVNPKLHSTRILKETGQISIDLPHTKEGAMVRPDEVRGVLDFISRRLSDENVRPATIKDSKTIPLTEHISYRNADVPRPIYPEDKLTHDELALIQDRGSFYHFLVG